MKRIKLKKLNNKGFSLIEVVLSFALVVIILGSMFKIYLNYNDKSNREDLINQISVFKNNILEVVYDDIIKSNIAKTECIKYCDNTNKTCINIKTKKNTFRLEKKIIDGKECLQYGKVSNNVISDPQVYALPDSENGFSSIKNFEINIRGSEVYELVIPIEHIELKEEENIKNYIHIVVSGKEFSR